MASLSPDQLHDVSVDVGIKMARHFFERRGRGSNVEAHVSEAELAGILGVAFMLGYERAKESDR